MKPKTGFAVVLTAAAFGVGCGSSASGRPPSDQWAAAQVDVGRAEAAGVSEIPDAKLHLQLAHEDLQKSKQLIGQDNKRAATLTTLASTEAQLALSLAREMAAQDAARKVEGDLQKAGGQ